MSSCWRFGKTQCILIINMPLFNAKYLQHVDFGNLTIVQTQRIFLIFTEKRLQNLKKRQKKKVSKIMTLFCDPFVNRICTVEILKYDSFRIIMREKKRNLSLGAECYFWVLKEMIQNHSYFSLRESMKTKKGSHSFKF